MGMDDKGLAIDSIEKYPLEDNENPTIGDLLELDYGEFHVFYIQGCIFRKDIIEAVGGFDEDMLGDDIILRTKVFRYIQENTKYSFAIMNTPACYYRMHDNNVHKKSSRQVEIVTTYLEKYWPERENPKLLKAWFDNSFGQTSISQAKVLLSLPRVSEYKYSFKIRRRIVKKYLKALLFLD